MTINSQIKLQNFAFAVRQELGFPLRATSNQSTKFAAAGIADLARGLELSALAQEMSRDLVYFGWASCADEQPVSIAVAFREEDLVDWVDGCELWATDNDSPLMLVDEARNQHFVRGSRGALERRAGLPSKTLRPGKRLARRRVQRAIAEMPEELLSGNVWMPRGARWTDHMPAAPTEFVARF